jgi:hypothetical protein
MALMTWTELIAVLEETTRRLRVMVEPQRRIPRMMRIEVEALLALIEPALIAAKRPASRPPRTRP